MNWRHTKHKRINLVVNFSNFKITRFKIIDHIKESVAPQPVLSLINRFSELRSV